MMLTKGSIYFLRRYSECSKGAPVTVHSFTGHECSKIAMNKKYMFVHTLNNADCSVVVNLEGVRV